MEQETKNTKQRPDYIDEEDIRKYYVMTPHCIIENLKMTDLGVYTYMKKIAGEKRTCWASQGNLAKGCKMCVSSLRKSFKNLTENGLIEKIGVKKILTSKGIQEVNEYRIINMWKENNKYNENKYKTQTTDIEGISKYDYPFNDSISKFEGEGTQKMMTNKNKKNNKIKKDNVNNISSLQNSEILSRENSLSSNSLNNITVEEINNISPSLQEEEEGKINKSLEKLYKEIDNKKGEERNPFISPLFPGAVSVRKPEDKIDLNEEIEKLKQDKRRHIQIIGEFLDFKGLFSETYGDLQHFIKMNLKVAADLTKNFSNERIFETMREAERKFKGTEISWTLGTIYKKIVDIDF
jgi:hypothetical protein